MGWHHAQGSCGPALQWGPLPPVQKLTEVSVKKKKERGWKEVSDESPPAVAAHISRTGRFALTSHSLGLFALKWSLPGAMSLPKVPFCS